MFWRNPECNLHNVKIFSPIHTHRVFWLDHQQFLKDKYGHSTCSSWT